MYYHYVTLATYPQAEQALEVILRIDSKAHIDDEIAPYEDQECETDIYLTTGDKLTPPQMAVIKSLNPIRVDLDNLDV